MEEVLLRLNTNNESECILNASKSNCRFSKSFVSCSKLKSPNFSKSKSLISSESIIGGTGGGTGQEVQAVQEPLLVNFYAVPVVQAVEGEELHS